MPNGEINPDDRWRLGEELDAPREEQEPAPRPPPSHAPTVSNLSRDRLTRPIMIVTTEHLAWCVVVLYALVTRTIALGARPLDPGEASNALAALAIAKHSTFMNAPWPTLLQGWIFAQLGAGDAIARIVVALSGLILLASAFAMRPYLGRAGALAFAAILAASPSVTYFSRTGSTAIASLAFMAIAIAIVESMRRRPRVIGAIGLAAAIGVSLSANPIGYATASTIVGALLLTGLYDAFTIDHPWLRVRIWWERRRALAILTAIVAIAVWLPLTRGILNRSLFREVISDIVSAFVPPAIGSQHGLHTLLPIFGFYEFMIVILAICGAAMIVSRQVRGPFAVWALMWAIVSTALFLTVAGTHPDTVIAMLIPFALLAAFAVEAIHQWPTWDWIRYALAAVAAFSLHAQLLANFAYSAPDTSEAPWNRHALLFWSESATSIQTPKECARAANSVSFRGATATVPDDAPQVAWYLRDLAPADSPMSANLVVVVGETKSGALAGNPDAPQFGFEEFWTPDFHRLTLGAALRYFLTMRAWSDVEIRDLEIQLQRSAGAGSRSP